MKHVEETNTELKVECEDLRAKLAKAKHKLE